MEMTSSYIPVLIALLAFIVIFFLLLNVFRFFSQREKRKTIVDKIKRSGESSGMQYDANPLVTGGIKPPRRGFAGLLSGLGQHAMPTEGTEFSKQRVKFLKAGIRAESFAPTFWGIKILLALLLPAIFLFLKVAFFPLLVARLVLVSCLLAAVLGFYLPDLLLLLRTSRRKDRLHKGLPDALDLMVVCVEAGMGLDAAINRVAQEIKPAWPDLSYEFTVLNLELRAGKARQDALRNLALRTDIDAVNSLVTLLLQTDKFGTSVSAALKVFSEGFRQERFQRAEERAAKLPVKLVFPLIFFIFPALFVVVAAPAFIRIYENIVMR